ncbi:precorrin-6y C5,15-methyltransferase (decarboxylating) subunit CbiE [Magnetospirillum sp. UT-4]|uniref:precorrin-6y C5,15-methyltransferase (decarboxylating) subunit CbiE n=1 Tax=Magnetospirillum sp. UT-4 TaxID=2681467 RepID=UPI001382E7E2|nr:precorrin-6y C5,15-methyltransferase (decarboxylating) subunit CbiE [Magnetospirillum sp. UT-4]CAA7617280.1 Precorrin-6Y C(5,15)-methyltransferase (decarboxylating) [Magnetospirillum sp. UT-4]
MTPWLTIIGIGADGLDGLAPAARAVLAGAEMVVGGERHLAMVAAAEKHPWPRPFSGARALLDSHRGRRVAVLASGDPMWFGIGATLAGWFDPAELAVIPHPGAFSLAAARLKWPLQECLCLTVHGRPLEALRLHLAPGRRLLVLAEDGRTAPALARLLVEAGFGPSLLAALESLGGPDERLRRAHAESWQGDTADLTTLAVECAAEPGRVPPSLVPGLPDDCFEHDGQLTKREVRAITLAALAPLPGELLWDVGAGSGSVGIEWMRAGGRAVAIEPKPERAARIGRNALALGVPGLEVVQGAAPGALPYSDPDAVFVGGGVSEPGLLEACRAALRPGGRLVANAVTAEGEAALLGFRSAHGGELVRLAVSQLAPVGGFHTWHPAMPVTQYRGRKT